MFTSLMPLWTSCWPALGAAAFLGVAYSLFAYVGVTHGKEREGARAEPAPFQFVRAVIASLALPLDIGLII